MIHGVGPKITCTDHSVAFGKKSWVDQRHCSNNPPVASLTDGGPWQSIEFGGDYLGIEPPLP